MAGDEVAPFSWGGAVERGVGNSGQDSGTTVTGVLGGVPGAWVLQPTWVECGWEM